MNKHFIFLFVSSTLFFLTGCSKKEYYYIDERYGKDYKEYHIKPSKNTNDIVVNTSPSNAIKNHPTMKQYQIMDKVYKPSVVEVGEDFTGVASWYGEDFHGKTTSSGETYDMNSLTAAHKTLPMNTVLKVTNLKNGKSSIVRINDRGPFVEGRVLDLSLAAAKEIDMIETGTANVNIKILGFDNSIMSGEKVSRQVGSFMIQIGAFSNYDNALKLVDSHSYLDSVHKPKIKTYQNRGNTIHRVMINSFINEQEAKDFIKKYQFQDSLIIAE